MKVLIISWKYCKSKTSWSKHFLRRTQRQVQVYQFDWKGITVYLLSVASAAVASSLYLTRICSQISNTLRKINFRLACLLPFASFCLNIVKSKVDSTESLWCLWSCHSSPAIQLYRDFFSWPIVCAAEFTLIIRSMHHKCPWH